MSKSTFYPIDIQPGEINDVVNAVNDTFLDVKKTLDTIGTARGIVIEVTDSGSADVEFTVNHNLGVVPDGYIKVRSNKAGAIYDSGTAWSTSNIYLKCNTANVHLWILVVINTG